MKIIRSEQVAPPGGHYSHAVVHGGTAYVSGQLGRGPGMTDSEAGDIEAQTRRCLGNIEAILRAAGSDLQQLLKVTIYVSDISLWPAVNAVYAQILGSHRPARAVVPTRELHFGALIEIEAIAAVGPEPFGG
jgi:2-iminobutanoate/2-iminopropanoate deaminase